LPTLLLGTAAILSTIAQLTASNPFLPSGRKGTRNKAASISSLVIGQTDTEAVSLNASS
jgi:hypothetical protein